MQKVKGQSVQKTEWKRTDEGNGISPHANADGNNKAIVDIRLHPSAAPGESLNALPISVACIYRYIYIYK